PPIPGVECCTATCNIPRRRATMEPLPTRGRELKARSCIALRAFFFWGQVHFPCGKMHLSPDAASPGPGTHARWRSLTVPAHFLLGGPASVPRGGRSAQRPFHHCLETRAAQ